jgi:hypothetical protein
MIFIRFIDGLQVEAIQRNTSPSEDWIPAPPDFDWNKRYKFVGDEILEMTPEEIEQSSESLEQEPATNEQSSESLEQESATSEQSSENIGGSDA